MEPTHAKPLAPGARSVPLFSSASLVRIQALSGLAFAAFGGLHLVNQVLAAFGTDAYNAYRDALSPIYQYPLVEVALVLMPLVVHAAASLMRMRARTSRTRDASAGTQLHRYAGWFLLTAMFGHVAATRLPAVLHGATPNFEGVAFTFQLAPGFFYPYYALLALAGALHLSLGVPAALRRVGAAVPMHLTRGAGARASLAFACAAVLLGVAGLGGLLFEVPDLSSHPYARLVQKVYGSLFGAP